MKVVESHIVTCLIPHLMVIQLVLYGYQMGYRAEFRTRERSVPWKEWCGIRDVFAHQYSNLDCQAAWDTMQHDLSELEMKINGVLSEKNSGGIDHD